MTTATLLSRIAWQDVNTRVRHEQRNRQIYVPPISLYRWWARRPHALIGALIDAAFDGDNIPLVSDPFSGGGTVAIEAARRGFPLYAQDLHPWALAGLASALDGIDADQLEAAAAAVLRTVSSGCAKTYSTECPTHGPGSELSHIFWVRTLACPSCNIVTYLFPYSLVTLASRRKAEDQGYFGCSACGLVSRHPITEQVVRKCPGCDRSIDAPAVSLLSDRRTRCTAPMCDTTFAAFDGKTPGWVPVLVQRFCSTEVGSISHFDTPTTGECAAPITPEIPPALAEPIPNGVETNLLCRAGFRRWADLYPPRQLHMLLECASAIRSLDVSEPIKARLRLALCGAAEMAGFLSRWDRYYPKAFEATANHRFPALGFACETNLLGIRGRGTLPKRFAHSIKAARWAKENLNLKGPVRVAESVDRRRAVSRGALLVCGSSERQLLGTGSVDLVLTDPPYFDDVQYAELAFLFMKWAQAVNLLPSSVSLDLRSEAVANPIRGTGVSEYRMLLTRIFREASRTLKPNGRLILTFHNTNIRAWWSLSQALHNAGLSVCALAVAEVENSADHGKRNRNGFTSDLVIECRRGLEFAEAPTIVDSVSTSEGYELYAVGRILADAGSVDLREFIERYRVQRGPLANPRIQIPEPDRK